MISYRFTVESDGWPMLAEDFLLDPVEDRGLPAVIEPQHDDPEAGDQGLDQSWTHLMSSRVGDKLTPAPVMILTPRSCSLLSNEFARAEPLSRSLSRRVTRGLVTDIAVRTRT